MNGAKELRLDVIDLLLLNQIADFPNRKQAMKIIESDKIFFWMSYTEILEELPILNLKKQALRDRFDKLVTLGILEKTTNKTNNMTFFRLTDLYESLRYNTLSYGGDNESVFNDRGVYSNTQGVCSELHTISIYNNNNNIEKEIYKEKDFVCDHDMSMPTPAEHTECKGARNKNVTSKAERDATFAELWRVYERKGSKANAKREFDKLTDEEIETMKLHIPAYMQARPERIYRLDFERYIKHKTFNSVVYDRSGSMLFDPETKISVAYHKTQDFEQDTTQANDSFTYNGVTYR